MALHSIDESEEQYAKAEPPMLVTVDGISSDASFPQELNAK